MTTKDFIGLYFMTDSLIPKLKHIVLMMLLCCFPLPVLAQGSVKIVRYSTEGDTVTLRVQVLNEEQVPIQGLTNQNFAIQTTDNHGKKVILNPNKLKLLSAQQSKADPANLIILMDLSGSMKNNDLSGSQKIESAVNGIKNFITQIKDEKISVKLSIVPFGYNCSLSGIDLSANQTVIKNSIQDINNPGLINQLDQILGKSKELCAATNIYQPLTEAVSYLGTQFPANLFADKKQSELPKLAVILFSDGYDVFNQRRDESQRFQVLIETLKNNPKVTVHTMGYGEKLNKLVNRINCPLTNSQLTVDNVSKYCQLPKGGNVNQYIVDEPRLTEIANITGGIHQFPGNPQEVVNTLRIFLTTLREYEIAYQQPGAERAGQYPTIVNANAPDRQLSATSQNEEIRLDNFIFKAPSLLWRLVLLVFLILITLGGVKLFMKWSQKLKKESEQGAWDAN